MLVQPYIYPGVSIVLLVADKGKGKNVADKGKGKDWYSKNNS